MATSENSAQRRKTGISCLFFVFLVGPLVLSIKSFHNSYNVQSIMQENNCNAGLLPSSVDTTIINKETFLPPDPLTYTTEPYTTPSMCSLVTNATHHHAKMRFVVFQRDAGDDLYNLITYYTQVVPLDSLVVIDHQGVEKATQEILSYYGNLGMHVWRCEGAFKNKAKMWSHVTSVYSQSSDFVFPIDADEYLAILANATEQAFVLKWDQPAFLEAVERNLGKVSEGKYFKSINGRVIPGECSLESVSYQQQNPSFLAPACTASQVVIDIRENKEAFCWEKVFSTGKDFIGTDKGNHHGGEGSLNYRACLEHQKNPATKPNPYLLSNFVLLHMQDLTYNAWIAHFLRGASSSGFNKFGDEFEKMKGCPPQAGSHYCRKWVQMIGKNFSYWEMKKVFHNEKCSGAPNPSLMLLSTEEIFRPLCS
mmetsp:Transcript_14590/g.25285  ORF Transcript_14590/g.25285 Transcript_14590/m.25285 type:complete len:423 (-) Transcript_14590:72-1340(-)